jgi:bacterial/archaeal transporter family protein
MRHEQSSAAADALSAQRPGSSLEDNNPLGVKQSENCISTPAPVGTSPLQIQATEVQPDKSNPPFRMFRSAASASVRTKWFWYSMASCLCWTAWAFSARLASQEIPPATTQFVSAFGFLAVVVAVTEIKQIRVTIQGRGSWYALIGGLLLACGGIALYGAYRTGHDASVVTATTSLYPVATVFFAVLLLQERPNKFQVLGIGFAVIAIVLLSR